MRVGMLLVAVVAAVVAVVSQTRPEDSHYTENEQYALRIDAALDAMQKPVVTAQELQFVWPFEIVPYFHYEGLVLMGGAPPDVVFDAQYNGMEHVHIAGYTYCDSVVFLNARYVNPVSVWFQNPEMLTTLTHEMVHTLGGDFCSVDSVVTESRTQLATLEVLAAMANHGNTVALYALLDELLGISMNAVLYDALDAGDVDSYREFRKLIYPDGEDLARFEKSLRFWADDMDTLKGILNRYSVIVLNDSRDGKFKVLLPDGDTVEDTVVMDDLGYVLSHLDEMVSLAPPAKE